MEDLNAQAAPNWIEDDDVRITFEDIRPRNVAQELQEFTTHSPVLTVNELRALAHYDPLPDYRGLMTLDELKKGAPLPTTVPALLAEQTAAQQAEQEEAAAPAAEEAAPDEAAPADQEAPLEEQPEAEMKRWERKAIKALKRSGSASVAFVSSAIDAATKATIASALATARTPAEVREAFAKALDVPRVSAEEAADVLRSVDDEALRWARWALEERS
jgi:hypothetical protein